MLATWHCYQKMADSSDDEMSTDESDEIGVEKGKPSKFSGTIVTWIMIIISCVKMLLIPAYHSTDFEVHRNWLAITYSLPIKQWYTENTSIWTLDYPPLFAWFQMLLSYPAVLFDSNMLDVNNLDYKSKETVLYMRLTVIASDFLLAYGTKACCDVLLAANFPKSSKWSTMWSSPVTIFQFLLLCNVGLVIVDNIHFQYNGLLFGLLLLSIASMLSGHYGRSAFYFAVLLNMKHIFVYFAPAYFIYLLRNACFTDRTAGYFLQASTFVPETFTKLALSVITIFALSLGPFVYLGQTDQLVARLFPFKRGLFHSYWAPNVWSLYSTLDKLLETGLRFLGYNVPRSIITSGLTSEASYSVLPNVTPTVTFILTILFAAPCLIKLWKCPGNCFDFIRSLVLCSLTAFLFAWHVHEKAILMAIIPLCLLAVFFEYDARVFFILSTTGYFSLFPLLPYGLETPIKFLLLTIHVTYCCCYLAGLFNEKSFFFNLNFHELVYIFGFIPVALTTNVIPLLLPQLVFLPLLITSAYCALGIVYCWSTYYRNFLNNRSENYKRKLQ